MPSIKKVPIIKGLGALIFHALKLSKNVKFFNVHEISAQLLLIIRFIAQAGIKHLQLIKHKIIHCCSSWHKMHSSYKNIRLALELL